VDTITLHVRTTWVLMASHFKLLSPSAQGAVYVTAVRAREWRLASDRAAAQGEPGGPRTGGSRARA
jgi:hypothetical protein